jgi:hypothetical protein
MMIFIDLVVSMTADQEFVGLIPGTPTLETFLSFLVVERAIQRSEGNM